MNIENNITNKKLLEGYNQLSNEQIIEPLIKKDNEYRNSNDKIVLMKLMKE